MLQEILILIRGYLKGIWQYRWIGIVSFWVLAMVGTLGVYTLPDTYVATSRVVVDTDSLLKPLLKDISVTTDSESRINQITRTLLSRPNLERVAQMSDLDLTVSNDIEKDELLDELSKRIKIQSTGKSYIYMISFEHKDPRVAKLVVQSILNIFVESTLSNTRTDTKKAQKFINEQIDYYEEQLVLAEQRLAQFKRDHLDSLPRQDKNYYQNLQNVLTQLEQAKFKQTVTKQRLDALKIQLENQFEPDFPASISVVTHPMSQKLRDLQQTYQALMTRYTDQHPDVKQILQEINGLETIVKNFKPSDTQSVNLQAPMSPVVQQLKMELAQSNADLVALNTVITELSSQAVSMRTKIDKVIQSETQLSNLNRDYLINQKNYQALLERREAAKIAEDVDDTAQAIKFKIVDPPFVPSLPSGPNRLLLNIAVIFLSFMAGVAVSIARLIIGLKFFDELTISKRLNLKVLCGIPKMIPQNTGVFIVYKEQIIFFFALLSFGCAIVLAWFMTI